MKRFVVTIKEPYASLPAREVEAFIREAVSTWAGQLRPPGGYDPDDEGDALYGLGPEHVTVRVLK